MVGLSGGEWSKEIWPVSVWAAITAGAIVLTLFWGIASRAYTLEKAAESNLEIVYADECNLDNKQSLFRRSTSYLPHGEQIKHRITKADYYIGVKNRSNKTITNVQIRIYEKNMPQSPINIVLNSETAGTPKVDIPPDIIEYFYLGFGYITNFVAERIEFKPTAEIDALAHEIARGVYSCESMRIVGAKPGIEELILLKNDGQELHFSIFGDDVSPRHGLIRVNGKTGLEVLVSPKDN